MLRNPVLCGVKKALPDAVEGTPCVGRTRVAGGVGKRVAVLVGVNSSAPMDVTVGVNVSGVLVEVANRFWVGIAVSLAGGVAVSAARDGDGVAPS
jgi:hypothetical protein